MPSKPDQTADTGHSDPRCLHCEVRLYNGPDGPASVVDESYICDTNGAWFHAVAQ